MGRQKQTQMKEQENSLEELNERQASNVSNIEFRVMIIRILNCVKKDTQTMKYGHLEMKNAVSQINNTLEGINSRLHEAADQICGLEDKVRKNTQAEPQKEKRMKRT